MKSVYLKNARYIKDFKVYVEFQDGKAGEVNLKDIVYKYDIAVSLRDPKIFSDFHLDSWPTLAWKCGFDIAPETLYEKCVTTNAQK